jgi:imidazolonepropionase-like amidohydrolase
MTPTFSHRTSTLLAATLLLLTAHANADRQAFVGARIIPIAGPPIDDGVLVIEDGRILRVGAAGSTRIPRNAEVIELDPGNVILPGLVDSHSHVGEVAGGDASDPIQPDARALDSINVRSSGLRRALAGGITTVNVMSGSGHLISGQTVYLKLRGGNSIEELAYRTEDGRIAGGLKMANGTNSRREPPFPGTRAKSAALVRQAYIRAQEYRDKLANAEGDEDRPDRNLALEALVEVLEGERVVHHHTHRHDDVMTVLRLKEEFGYDLVLHHVSEAWKVAQEIAAAGVPVSLIALDSPGGKLEALDIRMENAAALERAGVVLGFHTDDWITDSRYFLRMAAFGVRGGMSRDGALAAVTLANARMLNLDSRIGTLERGKDADFVILSGDPLSVYTRVLETWVEGVKRFDLDDPDDRLVAEGGVGALSAGDGTAHVHTGGHTADGHAAGGAR